jgi:hypothetical protein
MGRKTLTFLYNSQKYSAETALSIFNTLFTVFNMHTGYPSELRIILTFLHLFLRIYFAHCFTHLLLRMFSNSALHNHICTLICFALLTV